MSSFTFRTLSKLQGCSRSLIAQRRQISFTNIMRNEIDPTSRQLPKKTKYTLQSPFTWRSFAVGTLVGGSFLGYFYYLREEKDLRLERERRRSIGKAQIGGKFELVNPKGELVKSDDFLGKWIMIYFGFTHCPDICPDEMDKLVAISDELEAKHNITVQPIFISVDPMRDTPEVVGKYCKEFSDKIVGLTGTVEQVSKVCKAFRVYFSNGPKDNDNDYIVDHTIIMYFIDPDGIFVDYYGQSNTSEQIVGSVLIHNAKLAKLRGETSWIPTLNFKSRWTSTA